MWNQQEKKIDALEVKEMRAKIADFAEMAQEILSVFNNIDSINIHDVKVQEESRNSLMIMPTPAKSYVEITVNSSKPVENSEDIVDLLQSALKESRIVKDNSIHPTLKNFLIQSKINQVHPMLGSTKDEFIDMFDQFIESTNNHDLTFTQKLKKFKK